MLLQDRVPYLSACPSTQIYGLVSFPAGWFHFIPVSPVGTASLPFAMLVTLDNCLQMAAAVVSFHLPPQSQSFYEMYKLKHRGTAELLCEGC